VVVQPLDHTCFGDRRKRTLPSDHRPPLHCDGFGRRSKTQTFTPAGKPGAFRCGFANCVDRRFKNPLSTEEDVTPEDPGNPAGFQYGGPS
jgi:hypothetical protein